MLDKHFIIIEPRDGDGYSTLLVDKYSRKVLLMGDDYHDKIAERIEGFISGVESCGFNVKLESKEYDGDWLEDISEVIDFYDLKF